MGHDHSMWNAYYVPLYRMKPKSTFNLSFSTTRSSASETLGFLGWSKVEHGKLYQDIGSSVYLSIRRHDGCNKIKECMQRIWTIYIHLETHAQEVKLW